MDRLYLFDRFEFDQKAIFDPPSRCALWRTEKLNAGKDQPETDETDKMIGDKIMKNREAIKRACRGLVFVGETRKV